MTTDQITSIVRAILAAIGGFVLAKGWVSTETWTWLVGAVVTVIPVAWGIYNNRPAHLAASAQKLDGVNVQTSSAASDAVKISVANAKGA